MSELPNGDVHLSWGCPVDKVARRTLHVAVCEEQTVNAKQPNPHNICRFCAAAQTMSFPLHWCGANPPGPSPAQAVDPSVWEIIETSFPFPPFSQAFLYCDNHSDHESHNLSLTFSLPLSLSLFLLLYPFRPSLSSYLTHSYLTIPSHACYLPRSFPVYLSLCLSLYTFCPESLLYLLHSCSSFISNTSISPLPHVSTTLVLSVHLSICLHHPTTLFHSNQSL